MIRPALLDATAAQATAGAPFFCTRGSNRLDLHSFPTRRSSDLRSVASPGADRHLEQSGRREIADHPSGLDNASQYRRFRSEEHTSELQSRGHLVCSLLLEKKSVTDSGTSSLASASSPRVSAISI